MSDTALASEWLPLAPAQLDFWEEHTLHPGQTLSTVAHCTELCGAVREEALCQTIATTLAETQAFALRFGEAAWRLSPLLRYDPQRTPPLQRIDLQTHDDPWQAALKPDARRYRAAPALHSEPLTQPGCSSWGRALPLATCVRTIFWLMASAWPDRTPLRRVICALSG